MLRALQIWTYAARPKTLFIGAAPILIGSTMALHAGFFDLVYFLLTLVGALMIQVGTNYCNDYFDFLKGADTSSRKGPQKVLQQGLVSPRAMKYAFTLCFIGAAVCSCVLAQRGGPILLLIGGGCILFSILYTAPPFPLAYLGLGDVFVLFFYGPIATVFCYYLQTLHFSYEVLGASWAPGLLGVSVLTMNNLRDYDEDKKVHKKTLVVRLGITYGKIQYLLALALCFLVPPVLALSTHAHFFSLAASLALLTLLPAVKKVFSNPSSSDLNLVFMQTARITPIYTIVFCLGWLF